MNLSQYKPAFQHWGVSGDQLSRYDDSLLESRLGITQRLHRKRLTMIISGSKSVQELFGSGSS